MSIKQYIAKAILKCLGWKAVALTPKYDKCVLVVAPHTSNWDFFYGMLGYTALGRQGNFLIKKDWFFFPVNLFFKAIGGIPVDRESKGKTLSKTESILNIFRERKEFRLGITPEGTRKPTTHWKRGFYYIAKEAHVPIILVKLDYGNKCLNLFQVFLPTGDEKTDIKAVKEAYRGVIGKHPKNFRIE